MSNEGAEEVVFEVEFLPNNDYKVKYVVDQKFEVQLVPKDSKDDVKIEPISETEEEPTDQSLISNKNPDPFPISNDVKIEPILENEEQPEDKSLNCNINPASLPISKPFHYEEKKFYCETCNKQFIFYKTFVLHKCVPRIKKASQKKPRIRPNKKFICMHCEELYHCNAYLQAHIIEKHSDTPKDITCDDCGKAFSTIQFLKNHMKCHKQEDMKTHKPYKEIDPHKSKHSCSKCSKIFMSAESLRIHEKSHDNKFSCEKCSKTFAFQYGLEQHMKQHQNLRRFRCKFCKASYNTRKPLKMHYKKAHKDSDIPVLRVKKRK